MFLSIIQHCLNDFSLSNQVVQCQLMIKRIPAGNLLRTLCQPSNYDSRKYVDVPLFLETHSYSLRSILSLPFSQFGSTKLIFYCIKRNDLLFWVGLEGLTALDIRKNLNHTHSWNLKRKWSLMLSWYRYVTKCYNIHFIIE